LLLLKGAIAITSFFLGLSIKTFSLSNLKSIFLKCILIKCLVRSVTIQWFRYNPLTSSIQNGYKDIYRLKIILAILHLIHTIHTENTNRYC